MRLIADPCMGASRHSSTQRRRVLSSSLVCATLRPSSFSMIDLCTSWMARSVSRISLFVCQNKQPTDRQHRTNDSVTQGVCTIATHLTVQTEAYSSTFTKDVQMFSVNAFVSSIYVISRALQTFVV